MTDRTLTIHADGRTAFLPGELRQRAIFHAEVFQGVRYEPDTHRYVMTNGC